MPKAKNLHSLEGARRRPKKPNSEQSSQIPSSGLNLLQALNAGLDAELLSRIEYYQRLAQEVDEHYGYKALVGQGKQAEKRWAEYMRTQQEIFEHVCEDVNELMCRVRGRNDILLLTQIQTAEPQARIFEKTKSTMQSGKHADKGTPAKDSSDEDALRILMSTVVEEIKAGNVTFRGAMKPPIGEGGVSEPTSDEEEQATPRQQIKKKTMREMQPDSGKKIP
jgi:hypothetical protein